MPEHSPAHCLVPLLRSRQHGVTHWISSRSERRRAPEQEAQRTWKGLASDACPCQQACPFLVDVCELQDRQALIPQPCVCYLHAAASLFKCISPRSGHPYLFNDQELDDIFLTLATCQGNSGCKPMRTQVGMADHSYHRKQGCTWLTAHKYRTFSGLPVASIALKSPTLPARPISCAVTSQTCSDTAM